MAWKDDLRPASFRGISFFVETSQFTTGRRVQLHEFPDRDDSFPEDLGKVSNVFKVEGHILGDDYFATKKALIAAVETEGPGELIHPYYGTELVQCGPFSIDEDTSQGRIAKISFLFYKTTDQIYPKTLEDKNATLLADAQAMAAAAKDDFDEKFSVVGAASYVVDSARAGVEAAADAFSAATAGVESTIEGIADLAFSIRNLKAEVNDLLQSPALLSQRLQDSLALLEGALGTPEGTLQAYSSLFGFTGLPDGIFKQDTPSRQQEFTNETAINDLVRRTALASGVIAASDRTYASFQEAGAQRDSLVSDLETQALNADNDDVFQTNKDLQSSLVRSLPDVDSDLPNEETVVLSNTTASLLLAYDLFENLDAEQDIINRNDIRHPGFILGGSELEVVDVRLTS